MRCHIHPALRTPGPPDTDTVPLFYQPPSLESKVTFGKAVPRERPEATRIFCQDGSSCWFVQDRAPAKGFFPPMLHTLSCSDFLFWIPTYPMCAPDSTLSLPGLWLGSADLICPPASRGHAGTSPRGVCNECKSRWGPSLLPPPGVSPGGRGDPVTSGWAVCVPLVTYHTQYGLRAH